jgi:protein involved in polysaccharide export with SLBB domain
VSVDFNECFHKNNERQNIKLSDGDVIVIPKNTKKVYVYGQVKRPGYVPYEPNKDYMWYVNQAGGFAENADEDRASIIRAVSKVWIKGEENIAVHSGDEIYVPNPPSYPPNVEQAKYGMYLALVNAAVSLIFTLYNIYKSESERNK